MIFVTIIRHILILFFKFLTFYNAVKFKNFYELREAPKFDKHPNEKILYKLLIGILLLLINFDFEILFYLKFLENIVS